MKKRYRLFSALLLAVVLSLAMSTVAFADTDGTEPKIVQQPDQLVLQLGTRWAVWSLNCAPMPVSFRSPSSWTKRVC